MFYDWIEKSRADLGSTGSRRWGQASDSEPSTELKTAAVAVLRLSAIL